MEKIIMNEIFSIEECHPFANIKGSQRIQVNNVLAAISIAIITILITNSSDKKISDWIMIQLSASIPLLITSSLCYTKCCYRHKNEYGSWNTAASMTHSMGYFGIINATSLLMYFQGYIISAWVLIISIIVLIIVYSVIDILLKSSRSIEKISKFIFYLLIIILGTLPMMQNINLFKFK